MSRLRDLRRLCAVAMLLTFGGVAAACGDDSDETPVTTDDTTIPADEDMSDEDMSDEDMSDEDMSDEDMSDEDMSDEDMSDEDMSDEG